MTKDELPIYIAIYHVEQTIEARRAAGEDMPSFGSDEWLTNPDRRSQFLSMIQAELLPDESLLKAYTRYRKSGEKRLRLMVEVAFAHGCQCFFAGRGKGECSNGLDLDRIVPGSRGGGYTIENCHIVCDRHNRERGDKSIEEYLTSQGC